ncbi:MAG: ABC transporter permease [Beijerinckiaceae bacterium]|nr:ABC transporter permease [Beijerinckiaceae bacterium]
MSRTRSVALVIMSFFLIWEILVRVTKVPNFILPTPSAIFLEILSDPLWYVNHSAYTVGACLLGFALALVIGIAAAIGIVYSRTLENTLYTLLVSLNSIPKIALAPLFIIWMGTGLSSKVAISMLIALFAIVIDTVLGLRSVDPDVIGMSRSMKASPLQVLWKIRFPTALPYMFAGMKVAISLALVGAIAGEFVASQVGLGYVIMTGQGMFQTTRVFAAIVLLGVIGTILFYAINLIERFVIPWHVSQRGGHSGAHG